MEINYKYFGQNRKLNLSDNNGIEIIEPNEIALQNESEIIQKSLQKNWSEFLKSTKRLLIIVNDGTRATPTAKVIEEIYPEIKKLEVTFIVALGSHRRPTEKEFNTIFGKFYQIYRNNIVCHDAENDEMLNLGTTSRGTEVKINNLISKHDKTLIISSVEPHYFAGYTGGRKSILPGIAAYDTIEHNHSLSLQPEAKIMKLVGNPVHEDMLEAANMVKQQVWACLLVIDKDHSIFASEFDLVNQAFFRSIKWADTVYKVPIKRKADIVVAVIDPPLDRDLYQAHKGIENARNAIKKDGIFILVSACSQGIGKDNFYKLLSSCSTPQEVFDKIKEQYKLGYHKAAKLIDFIQDHQLWMISQIPAENLEKIFIEPISDLQTAIDKAVQIKEKNADILLIKDAGTVVPECI